MSMNIQERLAEAAVATKLEGRPMEGLRLGPLEKVYVIWLAGASCDGCSIAVLGATNPKVEDLLAGLVPGLPRLVLSHTALSVESGQDYLATLHKAGRGELDAPYVVVLEGSVPDERIAQKTGGFFIAIGEEGGKPIPTAEWITRLAPRAAAMIAIGTCATWGGVPAAEGNATGAMGLMDFVGKDYRSAFGLPIVNVPGCSPVGDNFMETVAAVLLFLQGLAPLPELDELGRPAWIYGETVHRNCPRAGYYEEGVFAKEYGGKECLVELGCWGPVVQCNISSRGMINGIGGCMNMGGICIGCTMPGFPDKFSPIYSKPPGAEVSALVAKRIAGTLIKPLRNLTQRDKNRSIRWERDVPSGWSAEKAAPSAAERVIEYFYTRIQKSR